MLEALDRLPDDPVLGLIALFAEDPHPRKLDLGVGVYMDDSGRPPIMPSVKQAERLRSETETSKAYLGVAGDPGFNRAMERLVFGADHPALTAGRIASIQTAGGCAAIFYSLMVVRECRPDARVWISDPTWINHVPLVNAAGLRPAFYPYYDREAGALRFEAMMDTLEQASEGDVVLLHGCCHNPSGADPSAEQWEEIARLLTRKRLIALLDLAYQGLGLGLEADAFAVRRLAETQEELFVATSCSKNFGLYRDRAGSAHVLGTDPARAEAAFSHLARLTRSTTSMPPAHGAAIVRAILEDATLDRQWRGELEAMRGRILGMRTLLADELSAAGLAGFDYLRDQRGMFSFLPLSPEQIAALRARHGIYMLDNGRINLSGLNSANVGHLVAALADLLAEDAVPA